MPVNIEFIRRINGLDRIPDVQRIIFDGSYLVLGWATCFSARRWPRRSIRAIGW